MMKERRPRTAVSPAVLVWARVSRTVLLALVLAGLVAVPAQAEFGLSDFSATLDSPQAGAHADLSLNWTFNTVPDPFIGTAPDEHVGTIRVDLPAGYLGTAAKLPTCPRTALDSFVNNCPAESQVGETFLSFSFFPFPVPGQIYNIAPAPGEPARLAMYTPMIPVPVFIDLDVRSGSDYGLTATVRNIPDAFPIVGISQTLWGVPADHNGSGAPRVPFMVNGTDCSAAPVLRTSVRSYEHADVWRDYSTALPAPTGCDQLRFRPGLKVLPENAVVDQPSAVQVDLTVDQNDDPDGLGSPALRKAIVNLPDGVTINPSLAHDRSSCSDAQFARNSGGPTSCPSGSKIGTIGLDVPALRAPLPGDIYLGDPKPGNPFRLFLYAEGQGVRVKLEGRVIPDPKTGKLSTVFDDNPQVPFRRLNLRFQGGGNAALLMPPSCGVKVAQAGLTPYGGADALTSATFSIANDLQGGACPDVQPFSPSFQAGVTNPNAGEFTPFTMTFGRPDGHQTLSSLRAHLPAGLLGRLADFTMCPVAKADADECTGESLVGGVIVSAGSGSAPLNVAGRVYLTEPFKPGQVAGLAIVVPAAAGPYHLGTPVVHTGITVNPDTSLSVESDPLPTILSGVDLRIKQVIVNLDRQGFMFNPTDCSPKSIDATIVSTSGTEAPVSSPFGVRNCAALPFAPQVSVATVQPPKAGDTTSLDVKITPNAGDANMKTVTVTLPSGLGSRLQGPIQSPCQDEQLAQNACPDAARVGTATASTPVLSQPLSGPVYFLQNPKGGLPKLAILLRGQVNINLIGDVNLEKSGRIITVVPNVPDVPISSFELSLVSGDHAALTGANLCGTNPTADVHIDGQNGKASDAAVKVAVAGCGKTLSAKSKSKKSAKSKHHKHASKRKASKRRAATHRASTRRGASH